MTVKVKNVRRGKLRLAFGVTLTPGMNSVDAAAWAKCSGHPITLHYVQRGDVIEVDAASGSITPLSSLVEKQRGESQADADPDAARYREPESPAITLPEVHTPPQQDTPFTDGYPVTPAAVGAVPDLAAMRAKDAITSLLSIDSKATLRVLLATETRSTVTKAIIRRLGELGAQ